MIVLAAQGYFALVQTKMEQFSTKPSLFTRKLVRLNPFECILKCVTK